MKYKLLVPTLFFVLLMTSCRKDLLHWQRVTRINTGTTARMNRILFLEDGTGIISAGAKFDQARIFISSDNGNTWISREVPDMPVGLYGISTVPGSNKLVFSAEYGNIISTGDQGGTFEARKVSGMLEFISAIAFTGTDRCVGITDLTRDSGAVFCTDGSARLLQFRRYNYPLHDMKFFGPETGFVAGSGVVMKTTDGGNTWHNLPVIGDDFRHISALDANRIWICGYNGTVIRTLDGGNSWKKLRNGNDITLPRYHLEGIWFRDEQHGYAVGEQGLVCYTDDGGTHWMEFDRFTDDALFFIAPCADGQLIVGGENGSLYKLMQK